MQIVIDIPKEKYDLCKKWKPSERNELQEAVANGTPLPKGHGRLIDADAVKGKYPLMENDFGMTFNEGIHRAIDSMQTIIEADKAEQGSATH